MTGVPPAALPAGATPADTTPGAVPGVARRLACFIYEGVLLFGVVMIAGYLYSTLTQQRHALQGTTGLQIFLFLVLGVYFMWFWSHGGQTVAMKAWHVRLTTMRGGPVGQGRALARYLLSWMWFMPSLALIHFSGLHDGGEIAGILIAGVLGFAGLAYLRQDRQFWHDALCGTQLITWRPMPPRRAP